VLQALIIKRPVKITFSKRLKISVFLIMDALTLPVIPSHRHISASPEELALLKHCRPYTMTPPEVTLNAIRAAQYVAEYNIPGAVVECGVWRGGVSMAMAARLKMARQFKDLYLYDTFDGMSEPTENDIAPSGQKADVLLKNLEKDEQNHIWAFAPIDKVRKNVESVGYPADKIKFVVGKVEDTIPETMPDQIALLRLDTDWYESTKHELLHLYPLLVSGGVLILDDYGYWAGARKAVDEFFNSLPMKSELNIVHDGIADSARWAIKP
jgi:O-methyltransferase